MLDPCIPLKDVIHIRRVTAFNSSGKPTLGEARERKAHIESQTRIVPTVAGEKRETFHKLILDHRSDNDEVSKDDRFFIFGADPSNAKLARKPDIVQSFPDEYESISHWEVEL